MLQHDLINRCVSCQAFVSVAMRTKNDNSALATITNRASPLGIYVIGGRNVVDSQLCTVERYNVAKDSWTPMVCGDDYCTYVFLYQIGHDVEQLLHLIFSLICYSFE